jgi:hypothetical protein
MNEQPEMPAEVVRLLSSSVDSFEKVEVLFLAWREPTDAWTVEQTAERLRLPAESIGAVLDELRAAGLLAIDGQGYRFAPSRDEDHIAAVALCRLYDADRLAVLKEMTSLAMDRIRSSAARAFSDAFRIRRRDPGKGGSDA